MKTSAIAFAALALLFARSANAQAHGACALATDWVQQGDDDAVLVVPAMAGNQRLSMMIDTGSPTSLADSTLGRYADGISAEAESQASYGGAFATRHAKAFRFSISGREMSIDNVGLADLSNLRSAGSAINMVIGRDILSHCAIEIDSDRNRFRVLDANALGRDFSGTHSIPLSRTRGAPKISISVGGSKPFEAVVDTGNEDSILLSSDTWQAVKPKGVRQTTAASAGIGGVVVEGLAFVPTASAGSSIFNDVEVRISQHESDGSKRAPNANVIGIPFLKLANTIIDLSNNVISFSPRKTPPPLPVKSTSGLMAVSLGDKLKIVHVMQDSPAASAGLVETDEICRIDGQRIGADYEASPMRTWSRGRPGRVIHLSLCDGREKQVVLREFY
ncbi:PDZ domain-containing protein [Sphingomonas sanguinis]|uniref:PDZ domain-containing protein n=1 Tax=Sphingomonas sanguinis TaxID=33051 RepID=UPI000AC3C03B|nr:PDZ domain-containing protein [Sphingomonas sanguinis]